MARFVKGAARACCFAAGIVLISTYAVEMSVAIGPSMLPTLGLGPSIVLTDKISPMLGRIRRGDVLVYVSPLDAGRLVVKRLVAVGGDQIVVRGKPLTVPHGALWMEGDNRSNSRDSADYGPVQAGLVRGKVFMTLFPFGFVRNALN